MLLAVKEGEVLHKVKYTNNKAKQYTKIYH